MLHKVKGIKDVKLNIRIKLWLFENGKSKINSIIYDEYPKTIFYQYHGDIYIVNSTIGKINNTV